MRIATQTHAHAPAAIAWEECACPLCDSISFKPLFDAPDTNTGMRFLVVTCRRCGLCFTNPRPEPLAIRSFYPDDYRGHQVKSSRKTDALAKHLPIHGDARLLDFGCGAGDFLAKMQALGWNGVGLDASENAVAQVRNRGLVAHVGTLPNARWSAECFEALTMRQSLEHTHRPLDVLHAAYRLLTPGGRLVVTVPNFDSLTAQWFGSNWYGLDVPRHLTHFTPITLTAMLDRSGFTNVEMHQETHASWIRHSAELALKRGDTRRIARWLQLRWMSSAAGWWSRVVGRADSLLAIAIKT